MYNSLTLYICVYTHVNLLAHNKECFYHSLSIPCASSQLIIFRVSHYSDVHYHRLDLFFFCFFFNSFVLGFFHSIFSLWDSSVSSLITVICGFSLLRNISLGKYILIFIFHHWGTLDEFQFAASLNEAAMHFLVQVFGRKKHSFPDPGMDSLGLRYSLIDTPKFSNVIIPVDTLTSSSW